MPLTKNELKLFNLLYLKKYRQKYGFFIAEGEKIILDLLNSGIQPFKLFSTQKIYTKYNVEIITEKELFQVSSQKKPNKSIAIFNIKKNPPLTNDNEFILALDQINDPGNLGTIIRICDWFGIKNILCSENSVDCYNIKVIQSSMGSISRVNVHYLDLKKFLAQYNGTIFGAFLNGENIENIINVEKAVLVMGNEANGISDEIESLVTKKITINKNNNSNKINSLNIAVSAGIIINQIKKIDF